MGLDADGSSPPKKPVLLGPWCIVLMLVFGWGLTSDLTEPWVGMHDWNGAFYSQLARNLLRYPFDVHLGMPITGMGRSLPPPGEWSFYATHPPALVWLVAGSFGLFGESEAAARLVPISASLLSLGLFIWIVSHAYGPRIAVFSGAFYVVMPMSVYFGRMVNHEAVCLACMLAVVAVMMRVSSGGDGTRGRSVAWFAWVAAMVLGVWTDWPVSLFGGLLLFWLGTELLRHRLHMPLAARRRALAMGMMVVLIIAGMTAYLVSAGLDGRWRDLLAIFFSRTGVRMSDAIGRETATVGESITHTLENLTAPLLVLFLCGACIRVYGLLSRRTRNAPCPAPEDRRSASDRDRRRARTARVGLHLICLTGVLWLACFARQYALHNYWLYYMGPTVALYAGLGLCGAYAFVLKHGLALAAGVAGALLVVVAGVEIRGVREYFARTAYVVPIEDLKLIRGMTEPDERVLLFGDYINLEQRGEYRLRSIVPPHLAYYLDRPFDQTRSIGEFNEAANRNRLLVITKADTVRLGEALAPIRRRSVEQPLRLLVLFENRGGGGPAAPDRPNP